MGERVEALKELDRKLETDYDTQRDVEQDPYGATKAIEEALCMIRALAAENEALRAQAVTVKPLEWRHHDGNYPTWKAYSDATKTWYKIDGGSSQAKGRFPVSIEGFWTGKKYQNLQQAKAAAQADYTRRILSAIEARPASEVAAQARKEALEESAKRIDDFLSCVRIGVSEYIKGQDETADYLRREIRALIEKEDE